MKLAVGSSTQIALLVGPLLGLAWLLFDQRAMNLAFQPCEVVTLGLATAMVAILTLDGESHGFEGVQRLAVWPNGGP